MKIKLIQRLILLQSVIQIQGIKCTEWRENEEIAESRNIFH